VRLALRSGTEEKEERKGYGNATRADLQYAIENSRRGGSRPHFTVVKDTRYRFSRGERGQRSSYFLYGKGRGRRQRDWFRREKKKKGRGFVRQGGKKGRLG